MSKMRILAVLLSSLALNATASSVPKLTINRDNIKVWTYQSDSNPMFQYRAETTFDVPMQRAVGLVLNLDYANKWVPYVSNIRKVGSDERAGEFNLYMVLDFPFPLADRDLLIKAKMSKLDDGSIVIKNTAHNNGYPLYKGRVRVTQYQGDWTFQPVGANKVKVTTTGYANPAGSIPISVVNLFVQQQPFQMLQKMRKELNTDANSLPLPPALQ